MLTCSKCGESNRDDSANFCPKCGTAYPPEEKLPHIGEYKDTGIYRITFSPVESEFADVESAEEEARHSGWGRDGESFDNFKVKFLKSTVTTETHPYICGECGEYMTKDINGKCNGCDSTNWIKRKSK